MSEHYKRALDTTTEVLMELLDESGDEAMRGAALGMILAASVAYMASGGSTKDLLRIVEECDRGRPQ